MLYGPTTSVWSAKGRPANAHYSPNTWCEKAGRAVVKIHPLKEGCWYHIARVREQFSTGFIYRQIYPEAARCCPRYGIATTFSPWNLHREPTVGIERNHVAKMSRMSQKMIAALTALAEMVRHIESIGRINHFILSNQETEWILHLLPMVQASSGKNRKYIKEAVLILQSQIESRKLDIEYVQKRHRP